MGSDERFSESDLAPSDDERREKRREIIDRVGATLACVAAGLSAGGLLSLGACAAPFVFQMTPAPYSGDAMGAAFARFDQIAIGCGVVVLGGEVLRTWAGGRHGRTVVARLRRGAGVLLAVTASLIGLVLTPQINDLHQSGVRRGDGPSGELLETIHKRAELFGKIEIVLAIALVGLHVFTLSPRRPEEDDDAPEPLPPGPFGAPKKADDA